MRFWPFGPRPRRGPPGVETRRATISGNPDQIARLMQSGMVRLTTTKK